MFTLDISVKLTLQRRHNIQGDNEFIPRFRSFEKISSLKLRIPSVIVFITYLLERKGEDTIVEKWTALSRWLKAS
jgi:hypothetical protein